MFHTFVETSDEISKAYFPCNFVVIIQLIFICISGVEERGASDDYLFFVFYVLINLTFSHFVLEIHFNEFMKDQLLYIVCMREDTQEMH